MKNIQRVLKLNASIVLKRCLIAIICSITPWLSTADHRDDSINLVYPSNQRQAYAILLLEEALSHSERSYHLVESINEYEQRRGLIDLANNDGVDVSWSMTSAEREVMLYPIRIPIFKGLIGWRIPLIHKDNAERFNKINDIQSLRQLTTVQMHDWPDTPILESNGFRMYRSSTYQGIFKMLSHHRVDLFPRSILEIWREIDEHSNKPLIAAPKILLHYPTAFYYFVNNDNKVLGNDIETGLRIMIKNGRFDELFYEHYQEIINRANLSERTIYRLKNPILPPLTPLERKYLWFNYQPENP